MARRRAGCRGRRLPGCRGVAGGPARVPDRLRPAGLGDRHRADHRADHRPDRRTDRRADRRRDRGADRPGTRQRGPAAAADRRGGPADRPGVGGHPGHRRAQLAGPAAPGRHPPAHPPDRLRPGGLVRRGSRPRAAGAGGAGRPRGLLGRPGGVLPARRAATRRRGAGAPVRRQHTAVRGRGRGAVPEGAVPDRPGVRPGAGHRAAADHLRRHVRPGPRLVPRQHRGDRGRRAGLTARPRAGVGYRRGMPPTHVARRGRLRQLLRERELDAALVSNLVNVRYLTGFIGTNAALLVLADGPEPDPAVFCTDGRYDTQAGDQVPELERVIARGSDVALATRAARDGCRLLGYESHQVTVDGVAALSAAAGAVTLVSVRQAVERLRLTKDAEEIELLRRACAIADRALADRAARDVIARAGYGAQFSHGLGHGVGLEIHEAPTLSAQSAGRLAELTPVTVEPGVYLAGRGGVRIEDTLVVRADGPELLTLTGKDLVSL